MHKVLPSALFLLLILASPARAQFVDEFRFGGTISNPSIYEANHPEKDQFGINAEILTRKLNLDTRENADDGFIHHFLTPRLHLGALANLDKNGTSHIYAGFTWHRDLTDTFFFESSLGGAINNGSLKPTSTRAGIGSKLLFRQSIALGINITEKTNILFQFEHLSHRDLAGPINRGLSNSSVKLGFKF